MKPHKHAELIKQWADGAEIEYKCHGVWFAEPNPEWMLDCEYRIKHEPKPLSDEEMMKVIEQVACSYDPYEIEMSYDYEVRVARAIEERHGIK